MATVDQPTRAQRNAYNRLRYNAAVLYHDPQPALAGRRLAACAAALAALPPGYWPAAAPGYVPPPASVAAAQAQHAQGNLPPNSLHLYNLAWALGEI